MTAPTPTLKSIEGGFDRGDRSHCWRSECRQVNGNYHTVTYETGPLVKAQCHKGEYRTFFALCAELWAHAG
jgi:hypothetical protein